MQLALDREDTSEQAAQPVREEPSEGLQRRWQPGIAQSNLLAGSTWGVRPFWIGVLSGVAAAAL